MSIDPAWLGHLVELLVLALIVAIVVKLIPSGRKAPATTTAAAPAGATIAPRALQRVHESMSRAAEAVESDSEATPSIAGH